MYLTFEEDPTAVWNTYYLWGHGEYFPGVILHQNTYVQYIVVQHKRKHAMYRVADLDSGYNLYRTFNMGSVRIMYRAHANVHWSML